MGSVMSPLCVMICGMSERTEDHIEELVAEIGRLHGRLADWQRTFLDLIHRHDRTRKRAEAAEANVARVEAAARAVLEADDGMATYEPCADCLRSGVVLVTPESDAAMDVALARLRAALGD